MLLWFDTRTLLSCQLLLSLAFSIAFFSIRRGLPDLRSVTSLAWSFLFSVPAFFLLITQGRLPSIFSVVLANLLLILSFVLFYRGILQLLDSRRSLLPIIIPSLISLAVIFYYSQVHNEIVPRLIAISINIALVRAFIAAELFRHSTGRTILHLFAVSVAIYSGLSLCWAFFALLNKIPSNFMQQDHVQTFTLLLAIFSTCLTGLFSLTICHEQVLHIIRVESELDHLSGTLNRRSIENKLAIEFKRIERSGQPLTIALIDIDNFKVINDTAGHAAGDQALRQVVTAIAAQLRAYDLLGRYGGDEFLLVLPQTSSANAITVAERVGNAVRNLTTSVKNHPYPLTISIGLTEAIPGEEAITLISRADQALYQAKHAGRDCTRTVLRQIEASISSQHREAHHPDGPLLDLLLPSTEPDLI